MSASVDTMGVQNQESEYGDKDPVRVVASVTSENGSDRDLKDRDQLARLGKKSVLRVSLSNKVLAANAVNADKVCGNSATLLS